MWPAANKLSLLKCAADKANTQSVPAKVHLDNVYTQAIFGNAASGFATTVVDLANKDYGNALISLFVGGTRQGIPGGGPVSQGAGGVVFTSLVSTLTDNEEEANFIVGLKAFYDVSTFAQALYQCTK